MLKADFHIHSQEDPSELICYDAKGIINRASEKGFDVLAITHHNSVFSDKDAEDYAISKGILLISGVEAEIERKHVIILNIKPEQFKGLRTFNDLRKLKQRHKDIVVIAPHPHFYTSYSLKEKFQENIKSFDAVEYAHFYLSWLNHSNRKAVEDAKRYNLPVVGSSDSHNFSQFNHTYTMVDSKKDVKSVLDAIKKGKVRLVTRPLPFWTFMLMSLWIFLEL
jgi:predicted metal-dependent phosphoesterase TrpH